MGTFDTLIINGIQWQTKSLGKGWTFRPGDRVRVQYASRTREEHEITDAFDYDEVPRRYLVQVQALEYALIEDGRLVGLATDDDVEELIYDTFDYYGHDTSDQMREIFDIPRPSRTMRPRPRPAPRPRRSCGDRGQEA